MEFCGVKSYCKFVEYAVDLHYLPTYMGQLWKILVDNIPLIIAVTALVTAFFQWRKSLAEANAFRQQIVSILHHVEGISIGLRSIAFPGPVSGQVFSSVSDVTKAVNSIFQSSEALFFGLLETKIDGRPIKNDLDKKYAEWAELNLDQKTMLLKQMVVNNAVMLKKYKPSKPERTLVSDFKSLLGIIKKYFSI